MEILNTTFYSLFGLIIVLFGSWSYQLLPYKLIHIFDTSRRAQLSLLFMVIMFALNFFNPEDTIIRIFLNTIILFFLYLTVTKQSINSFIFMISCLIVLAMLTNSIKHYKLTLKDEKNIYEKNNIENSIKHLDIIRNIFNIITIISICLGVSKYFIREYGKHYKKGTNLIIFILRFLFEGSRVQKLSTGVVI